MCGRYGKCSSNQVDRYVCVPNTFQVVTSGEVRCYHDSKVPLGTVVRLRRVDPTRNTYKSWTTHVKDTKLGRSTPIHDPAIILESLDCKSSVTKLANDPHALV